MGEMLLRRLSATDLIETLNGSQDYSTWFNFFILWQFLKNTVYVLWCFLSLPELIMGVCCFPLRVSDVINYAVFLLPKTLFQTSTLEHNLSIKT